MNGKVLNGRTLAASITTDNSHVPEFIRKCVYHDTNKVIARGVKLGLAWRAGPASSPKKLGWAGIWTHKSFRPAPFSLQAQQVRGGLGQASSRATSLHGGGSMSASLS
ncbi:hypothetical protein JHK82_012574 [Glycine max]|nr:hypothetical protein JHK82_012574 [Glycine max]